MTDSDTRQSEDEREIAQLLQAAGKREEMPADMKQRWKEHFRAELAPVLNQRRGQRTTLVGLAASIALIAVTLLLYTGSGEPARAMEIVAVSGTSWTIQDDREASATAGKQLFTGTKLVTDNTAQLAFSWGTYDVRLNGGTEVQLFEDHVALLAGELFVSDRAGEPAAQGMKVTTPLATISDIGTQFTVRWQDGSIVSTVRQGKIVVSAGGEDFTAVPAAGTARQVSVDPDLNVESRTVSADWTWIYEVSPVFETAGHSAYDFLAWSVAETGRELVFASQDIEIRARMADLNPADLSSFDPDSAVEVVLAATSLVAERRDDGSLYIQRRD